MSYTMVGAVTGAPVTGLTSPTYTLTGDSTSASDSRQSVVTALGGTQVGVVSHSVSQPFSVTVKRPRSLKILGKASLNGFIANIGRNIYDILIRKGAIPALGQPAQIAITRIGIEIPAGTETYDAPNISAMLSFAGGFLSSNASGIVDTTKNAVL